jgi:hypothetical protein
MALSALSAPGAGGRVAVAVVLVFLVILIDRAPARSSPVPSGTGMSGAQAHVDHIGITPDLFGCG